MARRLLTQGPLPVHTDGPLLHNSAMMETLRNEGILTSSDPTSISGGTLVVRAHGISPARRAGLAALPVTLADATCPDVLRIQKAIGSHAEAGHGVVIFGDRNHPEVEGLLGFASNGGWVVSSPDEVANLPPIHRVCLVSQSTQLPSAYAKVADAVRARFPDAVVLQTICRSTRNRQSELEELAAEAEAIVVVGDPRSANTRHLAQLASELRPAFAVQSAAELDAAALRKFRTVALTAGASTPDFLIEDVRRALEAM